jgi:hypothetical protein
MIPTQRVPLAFGQASRRKSLQSNFHNHWRISGADTDSIWGADKGKGCLAFGIGTIDA